MTTLIFPSSHSAAYGYYQQAMMNGEDVVCASSLAYDDTAYLYKTWFRLPSIYEEGFRDAILALLFENDIEKIYCPSTQVYEFLKGLGLYAPLIGKSPAIAQAEYYKDLIKQADRSLEFIDSIYQDNLLGNIEIAALLRQTSLVYGESHNSKLLAMAAIFADAPYNGGIVEVGALLGKTALAIGMLANWSSFTDVFIVDSWCSSPQKDSPQAIQDIADLWDWNTTFKGFQINTAVLPSDVFNYYRCNSADAHAVYSSGSHAKISVLHIDANHDYDQVKQDYDLWRPHVLPGGWLILDDYVWSHGDGPKRVGDAALENENIERAFTCGGALFMKFAEVA